MSRNVSFYELRREKTCFCICESKGAIQLRCNSAADLCLCFRYKDRTISLVPKSEISSLWPSSVAVQPGLCRTKRQVFSRRCSFSDFRANLNIVQELGDRAAQGRACGNLGNTHYLLGNFSQAIIFHQEVRTTLNSFEPGP